jgi:hypothetical protein
MNATQVTMDEDLTEGRIDTGMEEEPPSARSLSLPAGRPTGSTWLGWLTQPLDLRRRDEDHGLRNTVIAVASAITLGALSGAPEWYFHRNESFLGDYLVVDALAAFVLTPLILAVFLALPDLTARLLWRLRDDGVITVANRELEAVPEFRWYNHRALVLASSFLATLYFAFSLAIEDKDLAAPIGILVVITLAARAILVYVAAVTVWRLVLVSKAIGRLLREQPVHVHPLHPDRCGGLWIVGRLFNLTLNVAAVLGGVALCIFRVLQGTPIVLARRPELYLLVAFYIALLPSAFLHLLWRPHQLLEAARSALLKPMAREFQAAISSATSSGTDAIRLAAKADLLSQMVKPVQMLDEAWPAWPLRMNRLRAVIVTAILPVGIPIVTGLVIPLVTQAYSR